MGALIMLRALLALTLVAAVFGLAIKPAAPTAPHLAQAWVAQSSGDGEPGKIGKESYLYEDCKSKGGPSDNCKQAHIFDYGADNCIKLEINAGYKSTATGTWYVKCDAVDCCYDSQPEPPNLKQWDIARSGWTHKLTYFGKEDTTELNNKTVLADKWNSLGVINYTYFVTQQGNDTISHRIDYSVPMDPKLKAGSILYGDFQVQHDLDTFRQTFVPPPNASARASCPATATTFSVWSASTSSTRPSASSLSSCERAPRAALAARLIRHYSA